MVILRHSLFPRIMCTGSTCNFCTVTIPEIFAQTQGSDYLEVIHHSIFLVTALQFFFSLISWESLDQILTLRKLEIMTLKKNTEASIVFEESLTRLSEKQFAHSRYFHFKFFFLIKSGLSRRGITR